MAEELEGKHGVQSLEIGMSILRAMVRGHRSMKLKDIAAGAGMPPSKAHRYLVSLIRAGLVEQDATSSRYDLGPFALNIGLVAIDRLDRVRIGLSAIAELRDRINETTALAVWSERGPVIVRWERPRRAITVNVVTGTQLHLLTSAAGRIFAAWLPKPRVAPILADELKTLKLPEALRSKLAVDAMLGKVRDDGYAVIADGYFATGVEAAGAPVFNVKGEISMAMVVVGVRGASDFSPDGVAVSELRLAAQSLSVRLGYTQDSDDVAKRGTTQAVM